MLILVSKRLGQSPSWYPREWQWLHQCLSLAMVRGNTASLLACVQVWFDFSHLQCSNQCSCPSLASLQWIAIAFRMSLSSMSFIVFSMFFLGIVYFVARMAAAKGLVETK